ncbi:Protein of unknown function [Actinacidiphila paucisporea]|uniref:Uncharacterized protein n=1 Tax=Actinacidiphila paucisporea TaxID=310782 RepID=A0A1M7Q8X8_9ACTN|nr:Protein of unknown function [Actinacidiphila paucisporea]
MAAVFQQLVTERAWEVPAAGGSVLQQWPDIAPDLAPHVQAVGFNADLAKIVGTAACEGWGRLLVEMGVIWSRHLSPPPR